MALAYYQKAMGKDRRGLRYTRKFKEFVLCLHHISPIGGSECTKTSSHETHVFHVCSMNHNFKLLTLLHERQVVLGEVHPRPPDRILRLLAEGYRLPFTRLLGPPTDTWILPNAPTCISLTCK